MSEFTSGNIILKAHADIVRDSFVDVKIKNLNSKYEVFLTDDFLVDTQIPEESEEIYKEILSSDDYQREYQEQFNNINFKEFVV